MSITHIDDYLIGRAKEIKSISEQQLHNGENVKDATNRLRNAKFILCGKAMADYAEKMHINLNELDPSTKANLERIICGKKVK